MGFDIFAAGTNNFHYKKDGCEDGSTLELMKIISALQSIDAKSLEHFNITSTGANIDIEAPGITDLMISLAQREMLHNISNAVCLLAMNPNASDGWIYVNATQVNLILPNKMGAAKYGFSPGDSPAAEFVSTIKHCLIETDMTNFGVLMQLSSVLTRFVNNIDDSITPKISITLTN